jgi:hypothetical protein
MDVHKFLIFIYPLGYFHRQTTCLVVQIFALSVDQQLSTITWSENLSWKKFEKQLLYLSYTHWKKMRLQNLKNNGTACNVST